LKGTCAAARSRYAGAVLVALAALAIHARTLAFGLVDLDDRDLLVDDHPFLISSGSLWRVFGRSYLGVVDAGHAYYRPVVAASYALDARWSGIDPRGYHLTNVALYCASAALVHELLRALRLGRGVALAGGLAFAVHPALLSAAAWIPGRNDGLLALFSLAAWLAFAQDREQPAWRWVAAHFVLFALAIFTKETGFVLPLVWLAHVAVVPAGGPGRAGRVPLLAYGMGWVALAAIRIAVRPLDVPAGPPGVLTSASLIVSALGQVATPFDPTTIAVAEDVPIWPGVVSAAGLAVATFTVPRVRRGVVAVGVAAFVLFLVPVVAVGGSLVLASRLVLPTCGVVIAVGEIVRAGALQRRYLAAAAAAVVAGLASITAGAEGAFRNARAFAVAAVASSPHCALAHVCLGRSYQSAGDDDRALGEYEAALALGPAEIVHNNIAVIDMKRGRWEDAERELGSELSLNPRYGRAYLNRAIVLRHEGRLGEACVAAVRARALSPESANDGLDVEEGRDCGR
jgi:hypothetical protein